MHIALEEDLSSVPSLVPSPQVSLLTSRAPGPEDPTSLLASGDIPALTCTLATPSILPLSIIKDDIKLKNVSSSISFQCGVFIVDRS